MEKFLTIVLCCVFSTSTFAFTVYDSPENTIENKDATSEPDSTVQYKKIDETNTRFELYPTKNIYTFLKLDTATGVVKQLHISLGDSDGPEYEVVSKSDLTISFIRAALDKFKEDKTIYTLEEIAGRFKLYPTDNIYNFLLLDQFNGIVWQIQWSYNSDKRGIVKILSQ